MRFKEKLSPYPILDDYSNDYVKSNFTADIKAQRNFNSISGKIEFHMNNPEIMELIQNGKAEYVVHIECPATCYRKIIETSETETEFRLNSSDIAKDIEISTFIVSTKAIINFHSDDFHPDYHGLTFNILSNQILAVGTHTGISVKRDDRDLESLPSIIKIKSTDNDSNVTLNVNTDSDDYIIIGLSKKAYEIYTRLGKTLFNKTMLHSVIVFAMVVVLQRMCANKDDENFNTRHWFVVINNILEENNCSLDRIDPEDDSLLNVCQEIFGDPVSNCFKELENISERLCSE